MGTLQIALFGGILVSNDQWPNEVPMTREIQALLAYLLLHRHKVHSREVLAETFWGERGQKRARGSLNTALWKLKKALEPHGISAGTYLKNTHSGEVGFNKEGPYWLDIEIFEREIQCVANHAFQVVREADVTRLEHILELYKGELLEGFYYNWALRERERLRELYVRSLIYLLQYYGFHRAYEQAILYSQQVLSLDPLREDIHRELMRLYLENGERTRALRQYEICRSTLAKELRIEPMEDTQKLYNQILAGPNRADVMMTSTEQFSLAQAFRQIREANQAIDLAREQIQLALQWISHHSDSLD